MIKPTKFTYAIGAALLFVVSLTLLLHSTGKITQYSDQVSAQFGKNKDQGEKLAESDTKYSAHATARVLGSGNKKAIVTFLTGQSSGGGVYYNSTRFLTRQFLHDPATRIANPDISFIVICGKKLDEEKRERLRRDGAIVRVVEDIDPPEWNPKAYEHWAEQFTKLCIFKITEFDCVLYVDVDFMLMKPMDDIFDDPVVVDLTPTQFEREKFPDEVKEDEGPLPKDWLFAARDELGLQGANEHPVPALDGDYANGGFWIVHPDKTFFDHMMTTMTLKDRFPTWFMEQDMLNYVFRRKGPMPWRQLDWKWASNFVNLNDVKFGVHGLHGKFWDHEEQALKERWWSTYNTMLAYWDAN